VNESKLIMAMSRDAGELVQDGFCKLMPLVSSVLRVFLIVGYQMMTPMIRERILGIPPKAEATWQDIVTQLLPVVLFPLCMFLFLYLRNSTTTECLSLQKAKQNSMLYHIRQTLANYDLIRDYNKRGAYVNEYEKHIDSYNAAFAGTMSVIANNKKFAPWLTLLFVGAWLQWGGMQVVDGDISLGQFLNRLQIYTAIGQMWGKVYEILLEIANTFDSLTTLVEFMNLPTDTGHRHAQCNRNMHMNRKAFDENAVCNKFQMDPADRQRIELKQLEFSYNVKGAGAQLALRPSTASFPQGGLYTLVGPPSEGKGTILKLMGEVLLPNDAHSPGTNGDLIIPTHLRALHVSRDPLFVQGTLLDNLTFGCARSSQDDSDNTLERVLLICKLLNVPQHLLDAIKADDRSGPTNWLQLLSSTDASLLHTARALVANPEILCIHKPTLYLNAGLGDNMYRVLKLFVEERGLGQSKDPHDFHRRRPRTCILTTRKASGVSAEMADSVYDVSKAYGMRLVKTSVTIPTRSR